MGDLPAAISETVSVCVDPDLDLLVFFYMAYRILKSMASKDDDCNISPSPQSSHYRYPEARK